jgi:hypothetical protein
MLEIKVNKRKEKAEGRGVTNWLKHNHNISYIKPQANTEKLFTQIKPTLRIECPAGSNHHKYCDPRNFINFN